MLNIFLNIHQKIKSIMLQLYKYQKDLGKDKPLNHIPIFSTEDRNVLMAADDKNKIIRINDYLTWLNCNYGLNLETNISKVFDNSLPDPYEDMDICFNSAMKYPIANK